MIRRTELGSHVAISMEESASSASKIRIRTQVLCCCDCISRVDSLDIVKKQLLNKSYMYACLHGGQAVAVVKAIR